MQLNGDWHFIKLAPGLDIHGGVSVETRDDRFVVELPPGISLTLLFEGSLDFAIGGQFCELRACEDAVQCCGFFLNSPDVLTRQLHRNRRISKLTLFITSDWLAQHCPQLLGELQSDSARHGALRQFRLENIDRRELLSWLSEAPACAAQALRREARVLELIATLSDAYSQAAQARSGEANMVTRQVQIPAPVLRCKEAIDNCPPGEILTLSSLAGKLYTSASTLQRHFKNAYGVTVMEYVRHKRMADAGLAIARGGLPLDHVAERAGYRHTENFITAFRRHYGSTPAQFRRQHQRRVAGAAGLQ
ncbi:helix-turn-helix transcriptional regulator [Granulosicoccaceae sp. 1_MG-2023]|nr:helix-turn-helix transcriptional regulator [Granulosicoccaceae sp. 1_MG-2023]